MCAFVGLVSGFIVVKGQVSSLITTLGVGSVVYGFVYAYTGGQVLYQGVPKGFLSDRPRRTARDPAAGLVRGGDRPRAELFFVFSGPAGGSSRSAATAPPRPSAASG